MNLQEERDLDYLVKISARRFEESPFLPRQDTTQMIKGVYAGRFQAVYNGEDPIKKYWVLRQKALMFDVPEKPIEIRGPDATEFLNKIFSRNIENVREGRGYYAIACTHTGGIFMDGVLFKLSKDKYWYVQADGPFETWLTAFSEGYDVTVNDPKSRVLQIQGPASIDIMNRATAGKIDENMNYFSSGFFDLGGQNLYVSRTGFTNELGFEIYSKGKLTNHLALWDHLIESGKEFGMEVSSTRALTIRRIEGGIFGNLTDMDTTMTPFEAGLGQIIDLRKKDFVGRKALINSDKRALLFGLTCESTVPASGSLVFDNEIDEPIGQITAGVPSPTLGLGIGYVRFSKPGDWIGRSLSLQLPDKTIHVGRIVELPFFDREKNIVRGKDRRIPVQVKSKFA